MVDNQVFEIDTFVSILSWWAIGNAMRKAFSDVWSIEMRVAVDVMDKGRWGGGG